MPPDEPKIIFDNVFLTRNEEPVLNGISIEIKSNRVGIIGNNGSGKSSFVRLLNGLLRADQGEVVVHGIKANENPQLLPALVGFVFQNPDHQIIFPTVGEELAFGLTQANISRDEAENKAHLILAKYKLTDWFERPIHYLSEGQKHLVCILSLLIMEPKVFIFDEAITSLDLPNRQKIFKFIDGLEQQIIMISHDLDSLLGFDLVIWLDKGKICMEGNPRVVINNYKNSYPPSGDLTV